MWSIMDIIPLPLAIEVLSFLASVIGVYHALRERYSIRQSLILLVIFPDAKRMVEEVERHILYSNSDEPAVFRRSIAEVCTMLAVAVRSSQPYTFRPEELSTDGLIGGYNNPSCHYSLIA